MGLVLWHLPLFSLDFREKTLFVSCSCAMELKKEEPLPGSLFQHIKGNIFFKNCSYWRTFIIAESCTHAVCQSVIFIYRIIQKHTLPPLPFAEWRVDTSFADGYTFRTKLFNSIATQILLDITLLKEEYSEIVPFLCVWQNNKRKMYFICCFLFFSFKQTPHDMVNLFFYIYFFFL